MAQSHQITWEFREHNNFELFVSVLCTVLLMKSRQAKNFQNFVPKLGKFPMNFMEIQRT